MPSTNHVGANRTGQALPDIPELADRLRATVEEARAAHIARYGDTTPLPPYKHSHATRVANCHQCDLTVGADQ
jgi:hypothetical protein